MSLEESVTHERVSDLNTDDEVKVSKTKIFGTIRSTTLEFANSIHHYSSPRSDVIGSDAI